MAGHSKWKNIKHKKAAVDALKAKKFAKLLKEITVSAKIGGGDLNTNPNLRTLINKANEINMPKDNYIRAIKKGTGEISGGSYETHWYEGYGPNGIAVIVEVLSDNKNRAANEIRTAFSHNGGLIGENGCVSWMFEKKGLITAKKESSTEDYLFEILMETDFSDIKIEDDEIYVTCSIDSMNEVKNVLIKNDFKIDEAVIGYVPKTKIELTEEQEEKVFEFLNFLENLEDTQNVFSNI